MVHILRKLATQGRRGMVVYYEVVDHYQRFHSDVIGLPLGRVVALVRLLLLLGPSTAIQLR